MKKKQTVENNVLRGVITKKALLVWGLMFDRGIGNVSKKRGGVLHKNVIRKAISDYKSADLFETWLLSLEFEN